MRTTYLKGIDTCEVGASFEEPTLADFPSVNFKYASVHHVLDNTTDYVRKIIAACPVRNQHKYIVVDVKVHDLQLGDIPAGPFWHIDNVNNPLHPANEEYNHIFVSGNFCLTEFLACEQPINVKPGPTNFDELLDNFPVAAIIGNTIHTYRRHPHRATKAIRAGRRLLVRVTESDFIKPHNKPFSVTYRR